MTAGGEETSQLIRKVRFPLWIKLTVFSAVLATLPMLAVVLITLDQHQQTLRALTWERMVTFSELITETQESLFTDAYSSLESTAQALGDAALSGELRLEVARALVTGRDVIDYIDIYDAQGAWLDTLREEGAPRREADKVLPEALRQRAADPQHQVAWGEPVAWGGELRVPVVVPIRAAGKVTGYVSSHVLLEKLRQRTLALGQGRSAMRAYVVDQDRRLLAWSHEGQEHKLLEPAGEMPVVRHFEEVLGRGVGGTALFQDAEGVERLGAVRPIPGRGWAVVVDTPLATAYKALDRVRQMVLLVLLGTLAAAVVAALLLSRSLTSPIDRLMELARAMAQRRFDARAQVQTQDELSVLGATMEQAAGEIQRGEEKLLREEAIRQDLGRYLPREVVERVVSREQDMQLGGRSAEITVLFADVVKFTPLTEALEPEAVVSILNQLFTILTEIIFRHGGTVDKFIGDSVMAFWGAPDPQEDHAERAVEAAEDMMRWLEVGNASWRLEHHVTIELAIGICSGEAVVGNVGSDSRMAYTAIGKIVNTAARLEAIALPGQILIAGPTLERLPEDAYDVAVCGEQVFPNSEEVVSLYEVKL